MGGISVLNNEWLTEWAARIAAATGRALRDVVSTYPFDAADHTLGPPSSAAELAELREGLPWLPDDLRALYRVVGPVSLPDIANGYFVHPPDSLVGDPHRDDRRADRIREPLTQDVDIVVFGSNGGGDLYALAATDSGPVYRLQEAAYEDGIYRGTERGITVVGDNLCDFLGRFLAAVEVFARDGSITDL